MSGAPVVDGDGAGGDDPAVAATPRIDGRVARAIKTRAAIVDALLTLLDEGDLQPTANRIAERAGTSIRLIYHHYGDLESLFRAAASRQVERLADVTTPIDADLPLPERIGVFVDQRARTLEWITPVRRAAMLQEPFSAELRAARDALLEIAESEAARIFADVLATLPDPAAARAALAAVASWGFWNDLRVSGRDPAAAEVALRHAVVAVLGLGPLAPDPPA